MYLLIEYSRSQSKMLRSQEFEDGEYSKAAAERLRRELSIGPNPDIELVILGAGRLEDLHRTHGRYFKTASELLKGFAAGVAAVSA